MAAVLAQGGEGATGQTRTRFRKLRKQCLLCSGKGVALAKGGQGDNFWMKPFLTLIPTSTRGCSRAQACLRRHRTVSYVSNGSQVPCAVALFLVAWAQGRLHLLCKLPICGSGLGPVRCVWLALWLQGSLMSPNTVRHCIRGLRRQSYPPAGPRFHVLGGMSHTGRLYKIEAGHDLAQSVYCVHAVRTQIYVVAGACSSNCVRPGRFAIAIPSRNFTILDAFYCSGSRPEPQKPFAMLRMANPVPSLPDRLVS